jgi:hypothetical protein
MEEGAIFKTPEYWTSYHERTRASLRDANARGVRVSYEVLPGPGCGIAESQAGALYGDDSLPLLPFPGCTRRLGCACCYTPRVVEDTDKPKKSSEEVEREYREMLARLPNAQANAVERAVNSALRAFGIEPEGGSDD